MRFAKVLAPFPRFTAALLERAATLLDGGDGACEPTAANDGYSPGEEKQPLVCETTHDCRVAATARASRRPRTTVTRPEKEKQLLVCETTHDCRVAATARASRRPARRFLFRREQPSNGRRANERDA